MDEKAQISVELILVMAAVVALALLLVTRMQKTGAEAEKVFEDKSDEIIKIAKKT